MKFEAISVKCVSVNAQFSLYGFDFSSGFFFILRDLNVLIHNLKLLKFVGGSLL